MTDQEINEAVARKLGWKRKAEWEYDTLSSCSAPPDYCHSIQAAWEMVDKMPPSWSLIRRDDGKFVCTFIGPKGLDGGGAHNTAPMAICLAFLKLP